MRSDLVTNAPLQQLIKVHRIRNSQVTLLLTKDAKIENDKKGSSKIAKIDSNDNQYYIGIDSSNTDENSIYYNGVSLKDDNMQRLLYFKPTDDFNEKDCFKISKLMLDRRSQMRLTKSIRMMQCGIFRHWILAHIIQNTNDDTCLLYEEVISDLVDYQFGLQPVCDSDDSDDDNSEIDTENQSETLISDDESSGASRSHSTHSRSLINLRSSGGSSSVGIFRGHGLGRASGPTKIGTQSKFNQLIRQSTTPNKSQATGSGSGNSSSRSSYDDTTNPHKNTGRRMFAAADIIGTSDMPGAGYLGSSFSLLPGFRANKQLQYTSGRLSGKVGKMPGLLATMEEHDDVYSDHDFDNDGDDDDKDSDIKKNDLSENKEIRISVSSVDKETSIKDKEKEKEKDKEKDGTGSGKSGPISKDSLSPGTGATVFRLSPNNIALTANYLSPNRLLERPSGMDQENIAPMSTSGSARSSISGPSGIGSISTITTQNHSKQRKSNDSRNVSMQNMGSIQKDGEPFDEDWDEVTVFGYILDQNLNQNSEQMENINNINTENSNNYFIYCDLVTSLSSYLKLSQTLLYAMNLDYENEFAMSNDDESSISSGINKNRKGKRGSGGQNPKRQKEIAKQKKAKQMKLMKMVDFDRQVYFELMSLFNKNNEINECIDKCYEKNIRINIKEPCLIGTSTEIDNNTLIDKSMIGNFCTIGQNCRIRNCVLLDHVVIADKYVSVVFVLVQFCDIFALIVDWFCFLLSIDINRCELSNTVVGNYGNIGERCILNNCVIGIKSTVKPKSKKKNEHIFSQGFDMDDDGMVDVD